MNIRILRLVPLLAALWLVAAACTAAPAGKPTVIINSPASNSQFRGGEDVAIESTSTDAAGITRVELLVDGAVVRTDTPPSPQQSYSVIQTWKSTPGSHTISVRAFSAANIAGDPAAILVAVLAPTPAAAPTAAATSTPNPTPTTAAAAPTATSAPSGACTTNSTFVTDVTVPDGTALAPGQTFNKIWRVRNSGTCAWGSGYQFVFTGGQAMNATTVVAVPNTAAGATADLLVPMAAPTTAGLHTGFWQLRSPTGALFGVRVFVTVRVLAPAPPAPSGCLGMPQIQGGFSASPTTITAGQSATLSWGFVVGAQSAEIDNGIGGVQTPGSTTVSPTTTTTYTMTARCEDRVTTAQVTITVNAP
ncbi:MAG: hypothetical protein HY782_04585 [Chloroflexi bacterium]|nr:hypothetical protein [Chloroflexota bacterium]